MTSDNMSRLRLSVLTVLLTLFSVISYSAQRNEAEALEKAQIFYRQNKTSLLRSTISVQSDGELQLIYTCKETAPLLISANAPTYFYIFNKGNGQGFVIVSGDDATKTILGYSDEGTFSVDNMPENLQSWLNFYQSEIKYAMESGRSATLPDSVQTVALRSASAMSPLLGNIKWDQGEPYNILCPVNQTTKEQTVTGCVATAMAQIMMYHKWPVSGTGSNSYATTSYGTLSVDFSKTSYDWNNMLDGYGGTSTLKQDTAVATLMYHCGVAVNMNYNTAGNGGSAAYNSDAARALINKFGFDADIQTCNRNLYTNTDWKNRIKSELDAARPVFYAGTTETTGHAFVCDGYDSNNLFHINWGWGGMSNGYFELSALEPSSAGIGGATGGYSQNQVIITGIQKPDGVTNTTYQLGMASMGLTSSKTSLTNISNTTFNVSFGFCNLGLNNFSGNLGIGLYKNGVFQRVLSSKSASLSSYYQIGSTSINSISLSSVTTAGDYQLFCIYQPNGSTSWSVLNATNVLNNYLNVTISSGNPQTATIQKPVTQPSLSLTGAIQQVGNAYQNKTANFSVTIQNAGTEFYSNLGIRIDSISKASVSQYINYGVVCIPAGETKTFTFSGDVTCKPGSYYAVAVYDSTNSYSTTDMKQIGPLSYGQIPVAILNEPSAASLVWVNNLSLPNGTTVYRNEDVTLNAAVRNTGGFFDSEMLAFVFPSTGGSSLGYLGPKTFYIETNETQNISLTGSFDLAPGNYKFALYYYRSNWTQISNTLAFTLVDRVTDLNNDKATDFTIYPNPVKDRLNIKTAESIIKTQVFDLSGRMVLNAQESKELAVSSLKPGIYLLRVETENGVRTKRFIKE